jgi:alpha-glucoside transport system substrate-binding protein
MPAGRSRSRRPNDSTRGDSMQRRTVAKLAVLLVLVLGLAVAGCGGDDDEGGNGAAAGDTGGGEKIGGSVEILGAFGGPEEILFNDSVKDFETRTGIDVKYTTTNDLPTLIRTRVNGGNPPDIALFPQPGLAADMAKQGATVPLEDVLDLDALKETLIPGFLEAATVDGKVYSVPMRMAVKSILWYAVPEFEADGYTVPTTHQELVALEDKIIADGKTPLCLGYESGQATGWVGTDWIEEYMLRTAGPEAYDKWVTHELKFDSPEVREAFAKFEEVAFKDKAVLGGREAILSTAFTDAGNPMFNEPPGCYLYRQGNFAAGLFPDNVKADLPAFVNVAYYPAVEGGYDGKPILGGGDLAALFEKNKDNEAAVATLEFLASPEFGGPWAKAGGWLSPHKTFDQANYPDEITKTIAGFAADADVFRFDASDLMPAVVGAGTFWRGMAEWTGGEKDLDEVLKEIDESWPE